MENEEVRCRSCGMVLEKGTGQRRIGVCTGCVSKLDDRVNLHTPKYRPRQGFKKSTFFEEL